MKQFRDIGMNIVILDKYFKLNLRDGLKPYDLNATEGMVLLTLYAEKGLSINDENLNRDDCEAYGVNQERLISELHVDKGVMTRTMQSLEIKGYVFRKEHPSDARSSLFYLSERQCCLNLLS